MKKYYLLLMVWMSFITLCSCSYTFHQPYSRVDSTDETWMYHIHLKPNLWLKGADSWYFTGEPNRTERAAMKAPYSSAMTIMAVRVPQFTKVHINGHFQVQIIGNQDQNSVYILGRNADARQTTAGIHKDTLYIGQTKDYVCLDRVIIRIGVRNLRELCVEGDGSVTGRAMVSDNLSILSSASGNILLGGKMRLSRIIQRGSGTITVMGAYSPAVNVSVVGSGCVNICGRIGLRNVEHFGNGAINILGMMTDSLNINAGGSGLTALAGYAKVRNIYARDNSHVYLYWVNSNNLSIMASNRARVGLAGSAVNLHANISGDARLYGKCLINDNAYVKTCNNAHANIAARNKIFASARENSSIYLFGSPSVVSKFTSDRGTILHASTDAITLKR